MKAIVISWSVMCLLLQVSRLSGQASKYKHADSLKGSVTRERSWWDVTHYDLHVTFNYADSSLTGLNRISYKVLQPYPRMQVDLMEPMMIDSVIQAGKLCKWRRDGNAFFIELPVAGQKAGAAQELFVYFHGKPRAAKQPPWDGGVIWAKDKKNNPWISIACQGMAAGVWFPNKDHMYDEVDSASVSITAPRELVTVSNGRLRSIQPAGNSGMTYNWAVVNPINNYNIIPYIGKYTMIKDTLNGRGGLLDLSYWVLDANYAVAAKHFVQVKPMLRCFEEWFGRYPFYEDGYKLVEAPFLGMEHQSAIAYGNEFQNGYKGRDLSSTGWGLKWDFIIVHESGHEWFGNNISARDVADNWIHESFTAYSENLYTEYLYGKKAGSEYVIGTRQAILNDKPIISDYGVNAGGSLDLYYKGANMLHTIRQLVNNDTLWKAMLRGLNKTFWHQTVTTTQIEEYMTGFLNMDLRKIFDQYLRTTKVPVLEYKQKKDQLSYRWSNCVKGFNMPVKILAGQQEMLLYPDGKWQSAQIAAGGFTVVPDYYVTAKPAR